MQSISKETIEHADDFIFHLSDSQVKEWLDDLKKKQQVIWNISQNNAHLSKQKEDIDFVLRVHLTIFFCFRDYGITIPVFTLDEVKKESAFINKYIHELDVDQGNFELLKEFGIYINQTELINYVSDKYHATKNLFILINGLDTTTHITISTILIAIYSRKIAKLIIIKNK